MSDPIVAQLRRAADEIAEKDIPGWGNVCRIAAEHIEELTAELARLTAAPGGEAVAPEPPATSDAMRERIVAVLTPFAHLANLIDIAGKETYSPDSDAVIAVRPSKYSQSAATVGDLRRAAALLAELTATGGK